jgi:hypothetical protein
MTLIEKDDCDGIPSGGEDEDRAKAACELGAVVWRRDSVFFFGGSTDPSSYYVIQVVDGAGERIEEVWDWFVEYQNEEVPYQSPGRANRNTLGSLSKKGKESSAADPGFCQCAYTGNLPLGLDNLAPWEEIVFGDSSKKKKDGDRALRKRMDHGNRKHGMTKVKGEQRLLLQQQEQGLDDFLEKTCPDPSASRTKAPSTSAFPSTVPSAPPSTSAPPPLNISLWFSVKWLALSKTLEG